MGRVGWRDSWQAYSTYPTHQTHQTHSTYSTHSNARAPRHRALSLGAEAAHRRPADRSVRGLPARSSSARSIRPWTRSSGRRSAACAGSASASSGSSTSELFAVFHLMIAGRFRWKERGAPIPGKVGLAAFDFAAGTLILTEAGSKRQASLYIVRGEAALAAHDPGGLEVIDRRRRGVRGRAAPGESHHQARADRSASAERHRQRLLGRDPARGEDVADAPDAADERR